MKTRQKKMIEQLKSFVETLRTNPRLNAFDEAATKQAIILPLLHHLGWNTYNIDAILMRSRQSSGVGLGSGLFS
jgi:hypothetical protein